MTGQTRGSSRGWATFSSCDRYRYSLVRTEIGDTLFLPPRRAAFLMLNPSTADENGDDPTIRRCIQFAEASSCTVLEIVNLFALRSTCPTALLSDPSPVGESDINDQAIVGAMTDADLFVCAWGADRAVGQFGRDRFVIGAVKALKVIPYCLGTTANGSPRHPLYVHGHTKLERWVPLS